MEAVPDFLKTWKRNLAIRDGMIVAESHLHLRLVLCKATVDLKSAQGFTG
jgi:hypothetical protein